LVPKFGGDYTALNEANIGKMLNHLENAGF
jgi:hypothetical protein